jgi:ABC-2 type transport system ATP-binding protein
VPGRRTGHSQVPDRYELRWPPCDRDRRPAQALQTEHAGRGWLRRLAGGDETRPLVALDGLTLSIPQGTFYSLLGPNGAGKTTAIKILCTLLLPDGGTCSVAGFDVVKESRSVRRRLGVSIRGERSVYWRLTGRYNLEYFAGLYGYRGAELDRRVHSVAEVVGLAGRIDDYVERYSMGMKQRLAIGCALVHDPPVLLLDEPTIGLDPGGARELRAFIRDDLCKSRGVTVLYTTHYMHEAEELSDRVGILHRGTLIAEGTPAELASRVRDGAVLELCVRGLADGVLSSLRALPAVRELTAAEEAGGTVLLRIRCAGAAVPTEDVVAAIVRGGGAVLSLRADTPSLEDVFLELTGTTIDQS